MQLTVTDLPMHVPGLPRDPIAMGKIYYTILMKLSPAEGGDDPQ